MCWQSTHYCCARTQVKNQNYHVRQRQSMQSRASEVELGSMTKSGTIVANHWPTGSDDEARHPQVHGSRPIGCKTPSVVAISSRSINTPPPNASPEIANSCLCDAEMPHMPWPMGHGWGGVSQAAQSSPAWHHIQRHCRPPWQPRRTSHLVFTRCPVGPVLLTLKPHDPTRAPVRMQRGVPLAGGHRCGDRPDTARAQQQFIIELCFDPTGPRSPGLCVCSVHAMHLSTRS